MPSPNLPQDFKAVDTGKQDIQQRGIILACQQLTDAVSAVVGQGNVMAVFFQSSFDKVRNAEIIFYN